MLGRKNAALACSVMRRSISDRDEFAGSTHVASPSWEEASAAYPLEGEPAWDEGAETSYSDWEDDAEDSEVPDDAYEDEAQLQDGSPEGDDDVANFPDPDELIFGDRVPFDGLGIKDETLLGILPKLGFKFSTRVQSAAIPMVLDADRRAVVVNAETGSGKTLAYMLPAFELLMRTAPREEGCPSPLVLILVPGRELGFQVEMVARQIAAAIAKADGGRKISVYGSRSGWPAKVPDILITTPRAAAQGLQPCADEDEVVRRAGLSRIRDTELIVFDEADLLMGGGSNTADVRTVLVAMAASYPQNPREVLPEAQVYYQGGVPVEVLDEVSLKWKPGTALWNKDGTFNVRYGDKDWDKYVRRSQMRGPGIALHVENGPRVVMASATLPNYKRNRFIGKAQNNNLLNGGIGSPDWIIKRWFPHAVRIQSEWIHRRHPCIVKQEWVHIAGETKASNKRNLPLRIENMVRVLAEQPSDVRTLVFANTPDVCSAAEVALKGAGIEAGGIHAHLPLDERIESLKKFARGQLPVLVCTDVAARGIDLPQCRHVVQLEFAQNAVDHLHRVGRAARAGRLSKTTNFWGDGDVPVRDQIIKAPRMGLNGEMLGRRGNRLRLRRLRKKHAKQEHAYGEIRKAARVARERTARKQRARAD